MLSPLLILNLFIVAVKSSYSYPAFHGTNHISPMENMVEPELPNGKFFESNNIIKCNKELILDAATLEGIQEMIESLARKKGVNSLAVIRKLNRRMRNKEELEETLHHGFEGLLHQERPIHLTLDRPPIEIPPSRIPYYLPPSMPMNHGNHDDTEVVIIPVAPGINRMPMGPNKLSEMFHLRPPLGATVQVNSGDPLSPIAGDFTVSLSPFMTLLEVLRQAGNEFKNILGLNQESNAISIAYSAAGDCPIVSSIDSVVDQEDSGWKITVTDRDGKMLYDNFCLPADALVKPGTVISLNYVPLLY